MSQNLTPEERKRIEEEERIRLKTQAKEGFKMLGKMYLIAGAVFLVILFCGCLLILGVFRGVAQGLFGTGVPSVTDQRPIFIQPTPIRVTFTRTMPTQQTSLQSNENTISVYANKGWQDTGITIVKGQQVSIEYISGQWYEDPPGQWHDASGGSFICAFDTCEEPSHDFPKYALIGRIGEGETLLKIGNSLTFTAESSGSLNLRGNYGDVHIPIHNPQGAVTVKITVR